MCTAHIDNFVLILYRLLDSHRPRRIIKSSDGVTIPRIGLGIYRASFASAAWNSEGGQAARPHVSYRLPQSMQFYEVESSGPIQSVSYVITVPP